jgi:AcrR family transcriptional regulator
VSQGDAIVNRVPRARAQTSRRAVGGFPHGRVPGRVRSEQLLDVAERLFATTGFGATSIEAIAAEAGVTRPVVYAHFGSKDGIYLACLRRARAQLETMMFGAIATAEDVRTRIERGADAYFRFVESDPVRWRVLFGGDAAVSGAVAEEAMQLHLATERRFAELLARDAPGHDPDRLRAFSHAIGGAAHQLAQWWLRTPRISRKRIVQWYCEVTWAGLSTLFEP